MFFLTMAIVNAIVLQHKPKPPPVHHKPVVATAPVHHAAHHHYYKPTPVATHSYSTPSGYMGNVNGGGTSNPCNYPSGSQASVCNPQGQSQSQYNSTGGAIQAPSGQCVYVRMGEGYCPSTGQYVPMADPNGN